MAEVQTENVGWPRKIRNAIGWIIGAAVGTYSGVNLLLPLGATADVWWIGKKVLPSQKLPLLPSIAVQTGHMLWLSFGLLYVGMLDLNILDVVFFFVGLTWLVLKPGLAPIIFLSVFQVVVLAVNVVTFADAAIGTNPHKALLVHIIWRVLALFFMWQAYMQYRKGVPVETTTAGS